MNIFILSKNPEKAAVMQMDKHVVKMCLETAQILSTVCGGPYKPTHKSHPCTLWAGASTENFLWLKRHGMALCAEFEFRYGKEHACKKIIENAVPPPNLPKKKTPFALAMPEKFRSEDPVASYRLYYKSKSSFASWTKRKEPSWWQGTPLYDGN